MFTHSGFAQFLGGNNDGFNAAFFANPLNIYTGGNDDGYEGASFLNTINIYSGGIGDGYDKTQFQNPINIFAGGPHDGHDARAFQNSISIYRGGSNDGYDQSPFTNPINIFAGGPGDGYDLKSKILSFIWTGLAGTDWNVAGNWTDGIIPTLNSNVIIPSSVPNFPAINIGILSIGANPNGGIFLCKNLTVDASAEMTFNVDALLENYNDFNIYGNIFMLNKSSGALKNMNAGKITIHSGGSIQW